MDYVISIVVDDKRYYVDQFEHDYGISYSLVDRIIYGHESIFNLENAKKILRILNQSNNILDIPSNCNMKLNKVIQQLKIYKLEFDEIQLDN